MKIKEFGPLGVYIPGAPLRSATDNAKTEQKSFVLFFFVTIRKRSLGQGNVFTYVCHSVHSGDGVSFQGVSLIETPCTETPWTESPRQRRPGQRPPPYSKEQAVHILLECILFSTVALLESHPVHNLYFKKQFSIEFQSLDTQTIVICEVCLVRHTQLWNH